MDERAKYDTTYGTTCKMEKREDYKASQEQCPICGQIDRGQTGEHPCPECGLPRIWDDRGAE